MDTQLQHIGPFSAYVEGEPKKAPARIEAHHSPRKRRMHQGRSD